MTVVLNKALICSMVFNWVLPDAGMQKRHMADTGHGAGKAVPHVAEDTPQNHGFPLDSAPHAGAHSGIRFELLVPHLHLCITPTL